MTEVFVYDTTLRDGTQREGISLSVDDKMKIASRLDDFGMHYIEGGWPGSNPKDEEYFEKVKTLSLQNAKICAFGSTAREPNKVKSDVNIQKLLKSDTEVISIFGKIWLYGTF